MSEDIGNLNVRITADTTGLERGTERADQQLRRMGDSMNRARDIAQRLTGVLAAIGVGFSLSRVVSQFADFEQGMRNVGAVAGATEAELDKLQSSALRAAASTRFNPQQTTQALYALASSGQSASEQMASLSNVLNLAEAGQADLGQSTELLTSTLNQFSIAASDSQRVADVFVASIGASALNVGRLQVALRNAGPTAAALGQSLEQTTAALGTLTTAFGNGERAGTGLRAILAELPDNAEDLGISVRQSNGDFRSMVDILRQLEDRGISTNRVVSTFGAEAGPALAALLSRGSRALEQMEGRLTSTGQAADTAAEQLDTLRGDLDALSSAVSVAFVEMGERQAGLLRAGTQAATNLIRLWSGYGDELGEARESTEALSNAIEALAVVVGARLATALASVTGAMVAKTSASINDARAEAQAAAAVVRRTGAERQAAMALLNTTQLEVNATRGTNAHRFALEQLSVARTRAATAAGAHTAALNNATAAAGRASVAARGLRTALALVGGPLGLLIGAGGLLYAFRDELGLVRGQAGLTADEIDRLTGEAKELSQEARNNEISALSDALEETTIVAASAREELAKLRDENRGSGVLGFEGGQIGEEVRGMQAVADAQSRILEIRQRISALRAPNFKPLNEWMLGDGQTSRESGSGMGGGGDSDVQSELDKALDSAMDSFRALREEFDPGTEAMAVFNEESERMRLLLNNGRISSEEFAASIEQLREQMKEGLMGGEFEGFAPGFMLSEEELELLRERLEMRQGILEEFREIDVERESQMYEDRLDRLKEALENEAITEQEYYQGAQEAERDHWNKISSTRQQALRNLANMVGDSYGEQAGLAANALAQIVNATATHSERAFKIQKAAAIASAIVSTYQGVAKTLATYPWPIAGVMAAAHLATGLAQVQSIRSQNFSGGTSSGGGGGGSVSTASPSGGGGDVNPPGGQTPSGGTLTVQGISSSALFTGDAVRELAEELISYQKRGGTVVID